MRKTALYQKHCDLGAHMGQFAEFEMPIYYTSIIEEHLWTRNHVSLFDTAHMGLIKIKAKEEDLNYALTQELSTLKIAKCRYGFILNNDGGVVDDQIIYRLAEDEWMVVVNSGHTKCDINSIKSSLNNPKVELDIWEGYSKLDIQGPESLDVLKPIVGSVIDELKYFNFKHIKLYGNDAILSRTGYTGELGFEIYLLEKDISDLWDELMLNENVRAAGLGARDSLRLEKGYPLYGHELDKEHTPIESSLAKFINLDKDFHGKEALLKRENSSLSLLPFVVEGRRIARAGFDVFQGDACVGKVTSGTFSPCLEKPIGMAYFDLIKFDQTKEIEIKNQRGAIIKAKVTQIPFV